MCMYAHAYNVYIYIYTCLKFVAKHTYIYIYTCVLQRISDSARSI